MPTSTLQIDLQALTDNYRWFQRQATPRIVTAVVKSNAYGHGLAATARALSAAGCRHFAVFTVDEAVALRQSGCAGDIWILGGVTPDESATVVELALTPACHDLANAAELERCAATRNQICRVHLKVDTGMSRLGFLPDEIPAVLATLAQMPHLRLDGCFSHLAMADQPQHPLTLSQLTRFRQVLTLLPPDCRNNHLCATAGFLGNLAPELPYVRIGLGLYGYTGCGHNPAELTPAMTLKSHIMALKTRPTGCSVSYGATHTLTRTSRLAVIPVGYADGYPRRLGGQIDVLIGGHRVPIIGRVCMGMCMADVTPWPEINNGAEVVFLGRQGTEHISADELATTADTISYDILCALGRHPGGGCVKTGSPS